MGLPLSSNLEMFQLLVFEIYFCSPSPHQGGEITLCIKATCCNLKVDALLIKFFSLSVFHFEQFLLLGIHIH